ncbi:MmgE/PrpD family protein [Paracoccus pantotrophus]|uniref:MmgE/PrpD family protein n=1 Tax=Paracoccus pantotrophus TaxID=82367 RepID=UPI0022AAD6BA|nr:MmgE/PrpD family protein [Paracoccus pantotrophus]
MEVECRVAQVMFGPETGATPGWYPTGIAGGIGAAAAVGRLLRQDVATLANSMALAAAHASGTRGTHGAMSAYWPPAIAAGAGYSAAMLSSQGFTCPAGALSGPMGLIQMIAPRPAFDRALDGLGTAHVSEQSAAKIYPYGFISYAAISCALSLGRWSAAQGRLLERIDLHVSPTCARLGGNGAPSSAFEAQVSLACIVARVLADPDLAFAPVPENFAADHLHADLARQVNVVATPEMGNDQCRLVAPVRGQAGAEALMQAFDGIADLDDLAPLL